MFLKNNATAQDYYKRSIKCFSKENSKICKRGALVWLYYKNTHNVKWSFIKITFIIYHNYGSIGNMLLYYKLLIYCIYIIILTICPFFYV